MPITSLDIRVLDSEINPYRQMHVDRLFQYMQEIASVNFREMQKCYHDVGSAGYVWIINSVSLRLKRLPGLREVVGYSSYPGSIKGLFAGREYSFKVGEEWLGGASSLWFIADAQTHRPLRLDSIAESVLGKNLDTLAMGQAARRFRGTYVMPLHSVAYKKRAEFSDLDINGHMNNTRYIAWCMDALQATGLAAQPVLGLDINFLSELYAGDIVDVFLSTKEMVTEEQRLAWLGQKKFGAEDDLADIYVHALKKDGTLCFKAQLFFQPLAEECEEPSFLKLV